MWSTSGVHLVCIWCPFGNDRQELRGTGSGKLDPWTSIKSGCGCGGVPALLFKVRCCPTWNRIGVCVWVRRGRPEMWCA